jgi:MFS superfamily sulfate permease-like transporter
MQKQTRSLLQELEELGNNKDTTHIIENRAHNIITSAINLLELINRHYPKEKAELLERKLLSAIKSKNRDRFAKSLRKDDNEVK